MTALALLHVAEGAPVTPADVWHHWGGDPGSLTAIAVFALLYGVGVRKIWSNAGTQHVVTRANVAAFYAGIFVLLAALCSPLDALADTLFSAHMLQHVLLITVAAPLAVLGAPLVPVLWALPRSTRVAVGRTWNAIGMRTGGAFLTRAAPAGLIHMAALWLWHLPAPYSAALASAPIHAAEHLSFYSTALLVWWVALRPLHARGEIGAALLVLAGTLAQSGALGAILTFSGTPWYYAQSAGAGAWHLTALEDQQLAGLIMWIPASFIYLAAILAVMRRIFVQLPAAASRGVVARVAMLAVIMTAISLPGCVRGDRRDRDDRGDGQNGDRQDQRVADGNAHRGKVAIEHFGCGSCHAIPGIRSAIGVVGPSLAGIADRRIVAGVVPNTPDEMVRWIVMPQSMVPGNAMPNLGISDGEARDIAAYLYTLH